MCVHIHLPTFVDNLHSKHEKLQSSLLFGRVQLYMYTREHICIGIHGAF